MINSQFNIQKLLSTILHIVWYKNKCDSWILGIEVEFIDNKTFTFFLMLYGTFFPQIK